MQIPGWSCKRVGDIEGRGEDGDRSVMNPAIVRLREALERGLLGGLRVCEGACVTGVSARRRSRWRDSGFGYIFVGERGETEFFSVSVGFYF